MKRIAVVAASSVLFSFGAVSMASAVPAGPSPSQAAVSIVTQIPAEVGQGQMPQASTYVFHIPRWHAFIYALEHVGCQYTWGGTGPCWHGYDCSGLVYAAYRVAGVPYFGRDTYQMLASGRLTRIPWEDAKAGDLVFFGTGHVEMYASPGWTLGALHPGFGGQVAFHRMGWPWPVPSGVYHVMGAG